VKSKLIEGTKKFKLGNPFDTETNLGPLISEADAIRVEKWVKNSGGKVIVGGKRNGSFFDPTIVEDIDPNSDLNQREVFGVHD